MQTISYTRPPLASYQLAALFTEERYAVVEASTKAGKTVTCLAWLVEQALSGKHGQNFWWIAPIYGQAKIAYRRMKRGLDRSIFDANESELTVTLLNGAVIWFKGADHPDSLYGEDVYGAVIDEASRVKEEAWHAVRSTLTATRAPIRIIGNVKGRKTWAYRLARKAEAGEPGMHFAKITAYDAVKAGIIAKDEVEDAKRQLPDNVFRELYLAEPSDDEGNPFGIEAIRLCKGPLSKANPVAFGVDLAKSVDFTVIIGLDANHAVCHFERFQMPWAETLQKIRQAVGTVPAFIDSTGVGDPIFETLQREARNFHGYKFTSPSKQQLMEGLAVAIQHGRVSFPEGPIMNELESFEYEYTRTGVRYAAAEGLHDDCVCALALAVACAREPVLTVTEGEVGIFSTIGQSRGI
jgi:hypothetical protein